MFCPNCKAEYREGFTRCADCQVDLVDKLPEEDFELDTDIRFVEILRTLNLVDLAFIKSILDSEGIQYFIKGDIIQNINPLVDPAVLMVREEEADRARELLKDVQLNYSRFNFKK
ncbi:MAG: DUF2007 domain-containing protein [Ignavibacteria bacterium]|nr:DUF2007 domain-containing protein [Ignavibacteria bacterium]MCU7501667.1 DUF2007 domain-containing protein [Ignavibacteria bacterium]MCU7517744.1 DUF2007 domain-containing protein [Ignavibacteria bacterium]